MRLRYIGKLLDFPINTRLGWKSIGVANTLAYYNAATIMTVKCFIVQGPVL
jgi:hypothetical protein